MTSALPILPHIARLSSRVVTVLGLNPGPMTLTGTNTYIVGTGAKRLLVDAAEGIDGFEDNMATAMADNGCAHIDSILITHWHHDHVDGIPGILKRFGKCPVWKMKRPHDEETPSGVEYKFLQDKQVFQVEGATLRAVHTPGHSDDHTCFYFEEENALFGGDCILGVGTTTFSDLHTYMESLKKLRGLNIKRIYSAHGPVIENGTEKIDEYIRHRQERENQIVSVLKEVATPISSLELTRLVYVGVPEALILAAQNNLNLHLHKLLKEKTVLKISQESDEDDHLWQIKPTSTI